MKYKDWNDLIAAHFFHRDMAGKNVYLYVTQELISDLGQDKGKGFVDFIDAVKTGFRLKQKSEGICKDALWSMRQKIGLYPSYIGYLALFVLAAGIEGDFDPKSYYPRLRKLLNEPIATGTYPDFSEIWQLWQDLERWANQEKSGELGIFICRSIGKQKHIGLPLAQTLLSEEERRLLPSIFASAYLDPTNLPSGDEMASLLIKHGRKDLRSQTLRLLRETISTDELRQALLEIIIDEELSNWDGTAEVSSIDGSRVYGFLRLCCSVDRVARLTTFTLRCITKHEFSEDDLLLNLDARHSFLCYEQGMGWSSPLTTMNGQRLDASKFDWGQDLQMRSPDSKWCFRLPASPIRVFVEGLSQGLSGLVEVRQLPTQQAFYVAAHENCLELLTQWGESSCQSFEKLPIAHGLPDRWHFFKVAIAYRDELKSEYPVLAFPTTLRLELSGGIRIDQGNKFFKFAPPKVFIQGWNSSIQVYCNDRLLDGSGVYELPMDSSEMELVIDVRSDETIIKRRFLHLVDNISWQLEIIDQKFDRFGNRLKDSDGTSGFAGALVKDFDCPSFNFNTLLPIQGKQRVVFVGRKTGQISSSIPEDWTPVWIISKGRRSQVFFCGGNLAESEPISINCKDRKRLKDWKKLLWGERKTVYLPTHPDLRSLWKRFEKEAERV
ncbi:MAG: hypothetical protein M1G31_06580 [Pseudanabaena sp. Salubria-1]|jgi:hypothetical protein|nr:hypothetical protein [Pseudanabaena sp. Salubria-1]